MAANGRVMRRLLVLCTSRSKNHAMLSRRMPLQPGRGLASVSEAGAVAAPAWGAQETTALDYDLPQERIALRPVSPRDSSKLLVCDHHEEGAGGMRLRDLRFRQIEHLLPSGTLVVVNHSRVITARLFMAKETGGAVEVLCVSPVEPSHDPALALRASSGQAVWRCMVGGKRVKPGMTLLIRNPTQPPEGDQAGRGGGLQFRAVVESKEGRDATLRFWWESGQGRSAFGSVLEELGRVPLPPYMHRADDDSDKEAYNTVYAKEQGSVAAPTAGLHFTPELLARLRQKDVHTCRLTLHVGAGTFQPVEADRVSDHHMHWERFQVHAAELDMLLAAVAAGRPIVPCGTTSVRTLESLYWSGVKLLVDGRASHHDQDGAGVELRLGQWDAYRLEQAGADKVPVAEALGALRELLEGGGVGSLSGETQLMIVPGYRFAMCDGLITNFHQPRSTLLLLVGAVLGGMDPVHQLYAHALRQPDYRFLSFGDSSILVLPQHTRKQGVRQPAAGLRLSMPTDGATQQ